MQKLYQSKDLYAVKSLEAKLVSAGIECFVANEKPIGPGPIQITSFEIFKELWICWDEDAEKALQIFKEANPDKA